MTARELPTVGPEVLADSQKPPARPRAARYAKGRYHMRYHISVADRWERAWRAVAAHPRAVRFEELRRLLELAGWRLARTRGSHHAFTREGATLIVPRRTPHMLPVYVRQVLALTRPPDLDEED